LDKVTLKITGHVSMIDADTGSVILAKRNAIHAENMSMAVAGVMSGTLNSSGLSSMISQLCFGNGGTTVDLTGLVTYNATKNASITDTLYNQTHAIFVNNKIEDDANNISFIHSYSETYSDIIIRATLGYADLPGQDAIDDTATQTSDYVFDEIGLKTQQGRLLTHMIFHPVQKSANRKIQVVYTIRFSIG
jgi:hypothetical protein